MSFIDYVCDRCKKDVLAKNNILFILKIFKLKEYKLNFKDKIERI